MKFYGESLYKLLLKISVAIFFLIASFLLALYNNVSRDFLINRATKYFSNENFSIEIKGSDKKLTHIDEIILNVADNLITIKDIYLKREIFFSRPELIIENFSVKIANSKQSDSKENFGENFDLKTALAYEKKLKLFIKKSEIKKIEIKVSEDEYVLEKVMYKISDDGDSLSLKFGDGISEFVLKDECHGYLKGTFQNMFRFNGEIDLKELETEKPFYKISVKNSEYDLQCGGFFSDQLRVANISEATCKYKDIIFNFGGKIFLNQNKAEITTKFSLNDYMDTKGIPQEIVENFQNLFARIYAEIDAGQGSKVRVELEKNNKKSGDVQITFREKNLDIKSDISWVDFRGYKLKNLNLSTSDLTNYVLNISGDVNISSEFSYDRILKIDKLVCDFEKGKITSEKPFDVKNPDMSFKFKCEDLSFFDKIYPITGTVSGNLKFNENDGFNISAKILKMIDKDFEIYNGDVSGNLKNFKAIFGTLRYRDIRMRNFSFVKKDKNLELKSKVGNSANLSLNGIFSDGNLAVSGNLKNKKDILKLNKSEFNLKKDIYKVSAEIRDNKKLGNLSCGISRDRIDFALNKFSLSALCRVLDRKIIEGCIVDGSLSFNAKENLFGGKGHFSLKGLVSPKNTLSLDLNADGRGLNIYGRLVNSSDDLKLRILLPVLISRNLNVLINADSSLDVSVKGTASAENLFEFPDGIVLKGKIKSNLDIKGRRNSPNVQGNLDFTNAIIVATGLVLKNGIIKFHGKGNKLIVDRAEFTDSYGKKANIKGDGTFFFSHIIPNIKTNLQMSFDNFRLFDSDDMKINVSGDGSMSGPIDNLKISGNVTIPLCKLSCLGGEDSNKYKDIIVVNDPFLRNETQEKSEFFTYDINAECPKIKFVGSIYNLEFAGNLHLGTYREQSTLSGILNLERGRLDLFGKRMIFSKSNVEFFEKYPFDPKMKLSCSRNVEGMTVILEVKNTPGEGMNLNLYSRPNYSPDVILSRMMFGKSTKDLSVGEAAQLAHAINSLSQKGYIFSILNTFQNIGLVDTLSFSSGNNSSSLYKNSQNTADGKLNLKAGKYLSDNVFISVNQKDEETSFDVDLSINAHTSLKVNTQGEVGISWKYRY